MIQSIMSIMFYKCVKNKIFTKNTKRKEKNGVFKSLQLFFPKVYKGKNTD